MNLDQSLKNMEEKRGTLKAAFKDVAEALKKEMPDLWDDALEIYVDDIKAAEYMCRPNRFLDGDSPVEHARKSKQGYQEVSDYLVRVKYGVYC